MLLSYIAIIQPRSPLLTTDPLTKPARLAHKLSHNGLPHHDLHLHGLRPSLEHRFLADGLETEAVVELGVEHVAGFEVAESVLCVRL